MVGSRVFDLLHPLGSVNLHVFVENVTREILDHIDRVGEAGRVLHTDIAHHSTERAIGETVLVYRTDVLAGWPVSV